MSSKSPPSSALALNVNFKNSEIRDGYKYDGDNFLTWTNGLGRSLMVMMMRKTMKT